MKLSWPPGWGSQVLAQVWRVRPAGERSTWGMKNAAPGAKRAVPRSRAQPGYSKILRIGVWSGCCTHTAHTAHTLTYHTHIRARARSIVVVPEVGRAGSCSYR